MRVRRLIVPRQIIDAGNERTAMLSGDLRHYVQRVLRLQVGAPLLLSDGTGSCYEGVIETISAKAVLVRLQGRTSAAPEPRPHLSLVYGLARGARTEWVLQKCTELGVSRFVPAICERSVARPKQLERKADRWRLIVAGAARQSERDWLPEIAPVSGLAEALRQNASAVKLVATLDAAGTPLRELGPKLHQQPAAVALCVGPEGGLTEHELSDALECGFIPVSLGPLTLRTETAAIALVTGVALLSGRLG